MICSGLATGVVSGAGWVAVDADGDCGADWAARCDGINSAGIDSATNRSSARKIDLNSNGRIGWSLSDRKTGYTTIVMQRGGFS